MGKTDNICKHVDKFVKIQNNFSLLDMKIFYHYLPLNSNLTVLMYSIGTLRESASGIYTPPIDSLSHLFSPVPPATLSVHPHFHTLILHPFLHSSSRHTPLSIFNYSGFGKQLGY